MRTLKSGIVTGTFLLALAALAPTTAAEGFCDDINDVANGWAAIADALETTAEDDVGDLDLKRLEKDVNSLLPGTESLGEALTEQGDRDEQALGEDLLAVIDDLHEVDVADLAAYMVDVIDDLVDIMDEIVDYCDDVNG